MQRYAIVDVATNVVLNVVMWDGNTETWQPPEGTAAYPSDTASPGDAWPSQD